MKKNILIAFLLIISIYSRSNNLDVQAHDLIYSSYTSILLSDNMIVPNNRDFIKKTTNVKISVSSELIAFDSLCSLTKNKVHFSYDFKMRFVLDEKYLASIETPNGQNFATDFILPEIEHILNGIFDQYNIEEIYCFKREEIETLILKNLRRKFKEHHIDVIAMLFKNIQFSEILKKKIEERLFREHQESKSNNNG